MKKLHFEGFGKDLDLEKRMSDNYDHELRFKFEEESKDTIPNCSIRIYESNEKCSLRKCKNGFLTQMFGELEATGQEYGYSEYTIEGFNVNSLILGGHNIQNIINNKKDKYIHILIEQVKP